MKRLACWRANRERMQQLIGSFKHPEFGHVDELCQAWRETPLHTSPISLRFVREEQAQLSMQYGSPSCMIEMPMPGVDAYDRRLRKAHPLETKSLRIYEAYAAGSRRLFESVQAALMPEFGIRPHWGQRNFMTWGKIEQVYPEARAGVRSTSARTCTGCSTAR